VDTLTLGLDRSGLIDWYRANRARSAAIFASLAPEAYYDAPIPLRHPFVFYDGHLPAFSSIVLHGNALGGAPIDAAAEALFQRGIDPADVDAAGRLRRADWPSRDEVRALSRRWDDAVIDDLAHARLEDPANPLLDRAEAVFTILEHEPMHHETLLYLVAQLPSGAKRELVPEVSDLMPARRDPVAIAAGTATLGRRRGAGFGWDNEFDEHAVAVGAFGIDVHDVTNGEYLAFVRDGGPMPTFWRERDGGLFLRTTYAEIPLPASWPVYVAHDQAAAFAAWSGARLPTEAEYHRAAYGTPGGDERPFPWATQPPTRRAATSTFAASIRNRSAARRPA